LVTNIWDNTLPDITAAAVAPVPSPSIRIVVVVPFPESSI
jgi:hypothetical protein